MTLSLLKRGVMSMVGTALKLSRRAVFFRGVSWLTLFLLSRARLLVVSMVDAVCPPRAGFV